MPEIDAAMNKHWYSFIGKVNSLQIFLLTFILSGCSTVWISIFEGNAFNENLTNIKHPFFTGAFFVWPITYIVLIPILNTFLFGFYKSIKLSLDDIKQLGILRISPADYRMSKYMSLARSPIKILSIFILSTGITFIYWIPIGILPTALKLGTWMKGPYYLNGSLLFFAAFSIWIIQAFIVLNAFFDYFIWTRIIKHISGRYNENKIRPIIFHSDNAAGLSKIGGTALLFYLCMVVMFVFCFFQISEKFYFWYFWLDKTPTILEIYKIFPAAIITPAILLIILPTAFVLPVLPLIKALKDHRRKILTEFRRATHPIMTNTSEFIYREKDPISLVKHYDVANKIKEITKSIQDSPVLPFDVNTIKTFTISYVFNIAVAVSIQIVPFFW